MRRRAAGGGGERSRGGAGCCGAWRARCREGPVCPSSAHLDELGLPEAGDADGVRVERGRHAGEQELGRPRLELDDSLTLNLGTVRVNLRVSRPGRELGPRRTDEKGGNQDHAMQARKLASGTQDAEATGVNYTP